MSDDIKERIDKALALLTETQTSLEVESNRYDRRAQNTYWAYARKGGLLQLWVSPRQFWLHTKLKRSGKQVRYL
ncbi:MAG TPA: hypothetical protein VFD48_11070 [Pyrinomonadaceae bacterium]|nr:hypothetical protein [Pyrinomonadaceae bacterium]